MGWMLALSLVVAGCSSPGALTTTSSTTQPLATTTTTTSALVIQSEFIAGESTIVLERGEEGQWDSGVIRFPNVVFHDGLYHLFYEGVAKPGETAVAIGYATSNDGLAWTKHGQNLILRGDGSGFDSRAVSRPVVMPADGETWTMLYSGTDEGNASAIGLATADSPAGPWERADLPLLLAGPSGAWDGEMILPDQVIRAGEDLRLYYTGRDRSGGVAMIGMATSADGLTWSKHNDPSNDGEPRFAESDPVLHNGEAWDAQATWTPNILRVGDGWTMVYNGFGHLGVAHSDDGVRWTREEPSRVHRANSLFHPFLLPAGGDSYWVYYCDLNFEALRRLEGRLTLR